MVYIDFTTGQAVAAAVVEGRRTQSLRSRSAEDGQGKGAKAYLGRRALLSRELAQCDGCFDAFETL